MGSSWDYEPPETQQEIEQRIEFENLKTEYNRIINILDDSQLSLLAVKDLKYVLEKPWVSQYSVDEKNFYTQTRLDRLLEILKKVEGD